MHEGGGGGGGGEGRLRKRGIEGRRDYKCQCKAVGSNPVWPVSRQSACKNPVKQSQYACSKLNVPKHLYLRISKFSPPTHPYSYAVHLPAKVPSL